MWIKRLIRDIKQQYCRHNFVEEKNEYNRVSKMIGCNSHISYKCSKCGKIVWMKF